MLSPLVPNIVIFPFVPLLIRNGRSVWVAGLLLAPLSVFAQTTFTDFKVTHGPMLGRPGPTSMSIWLRTNIPGDVTVKYGTAALVQDQVSAPVATILARDNTAVITLEGLEPDTRYYYTAGNGRSGSFRTMPDPEAYRHPEYNPEGLYNFRFQYSSCANQNARGSIGPSLPMFDVLNTQVRDNVLFAIFNVQCIQVDVGTQEQGRHREPPIAEVGIDRLPVEA